MEKLVIRYPALYSGESSFLIEHIFRQRFGVLVEEYANEKAEWKIVSECSMVVLKLDAGAGDWSPTIAYQCKDQCSDAEVDLLGEYGVLADRKIGLPGEGEILRNLEDGIFEISIKFLSAIFVIITGYHEVNCGYRDGHDRHVTPNVDWLHKDFYDVPVVDYYIEILRSCLTRVFPGIKTKSKRNFGISPSHDVDVPFLFRAMSFGGLARRCAGDLAKRKAPWRIPQTLAGWWRCQKGDPIWDPYFSFDWIMQQSEERGLTSTFYFITDHSHPTMDGTYSFQDPCIHSLLQEIHGRGHLIGLHASYNSYLDGKQIQREFEILRSTCDALGIKQKEWGSRQHFLRWRTPETARHLAEAGLDFDATLGLPETGGFRNGTCHPFPIFDHEKGRTLPIIEKPLVAMECSFIDERYRNLGSGDETLEAMKKLKRQCRKVNGDFQLLWHNDRFGRDPAERALYQAILDADS